MKIERNTVQRQLVYHAAYKLGGHPTADAVCEKASFHQQGNCLPKPESAF